jgi:hypothetical protein
MTTRRRRSTFDLTTNYSVQQFLDMPTGLSEQEKDWVLQRIHHHRRMGKPKRGRREITATGAEFLQAIAEMRRVVELVKNKPVFLSVPGLPPMWLSGPLMTIPTTLFKPR